MNCCTNRHDTWYTAPMPTNMSKRLTWAESDGSIQGAVAHADGVGFDAFTIYDEAVRLWGEDAELLRSCVKSSHRFALVKNDAPPRYFRTLVAAKLAAEG